jgi:antitoxin YefM
MIALKTIDIRNDFKKVSDLVLSGEKVLIARPHNENLVVLSEKEYNELEKSRRNAEYLDKIDRSMQQVAEGRVVVKTMAELEDMAK